MHKGTIGIFFVTAVCILTTETGRNSYAYDGDVDFSAPYITLDPEAGKLITIDPTQNPVPVTQPPQHQMAQTAPVAPTIDIQSGTTNTQLGEPQTPSASVNPIIAVVVIVFVAVVVTIAAVRRKQRL